MAYQSPRNAFDPAPAGNSIHHRLNYFGRARSVGNVRDNSPRRGKEYLLSSVRVLTGVIKCCAGKDG